jgi:hypothetical protein
LLVDQNLIDLPAAPLDPLAMKDPVAKRIGGLRALVAVILIKVALFVGVG